MGYFGFFIWIELFKLLIFCYFLALCVLFIFATWWRKSLIFQTWIIWSNRIHSLKFLRSISLRRKDAIRVCDKDSSAFKDTFTDGKSLFFSYLPTIILWYVQIFLARNFSEAFLFCLLSLILNLHTTAENARLDIVLF